MGPSPLQSFCACKTSPELLVSIGPSPDLRLCSFKGATLGPELHVSMGPRPQL